MQPADYDVTKLAKEYLEAIKTADNVAIGEMRKIMDSADPVGKKFCDLIKVAAEIMRGGGFENAAGVFLLYVQTIGAIRQLQVERREVQMQPQNATSTLEGSVAKFRELELRKRGLKDQLELVEIEQKRLEAELIDRFNDAGINSLNVEGFRIGTRVDFWCSKASGVEMPEACEVLRTLGFGDIVQPTYNAASLKSRVKELVRATDSDKYEGTREDRTIAALSKIMNWGETVRVVATAR